MIKQRIAELLRQAVDEAIEKELLPSAGLPDIAVEHPQKPEHGDYATSLPLRLWWPTSSTYRACRKKARNGNVESSMSDARCRIQNREATVRRQLSLPELVTSDPGQQQPRVGTPYLRA